MTLYERSALRLLVEILHELTCINVRQSKQDQLNLVPADFATYKAVKDDTERAMDVYGDAWLQNRIAEPLRIAGIDSDCAAAIIDYVRDSLADGGSTKRLTELLEETLEKLPDKLDWQRYAETAGCKLQKHALKQDINEALADRYPPKERKTMSSTRAAVATGQQYGHGYRLGVTENTRLRDTFDLTLWQGDRQVTHPVGLILRDAHGYTAILREHPKEVRFARDLKHLLDTLESKISPLNSGK